MSDTAKLMPIIEPNKLFVTEYHDHVRFDYYMVGALGDPEEYLDLCHALRACTPSDEFFIRFNCPGGQVRTGNQIINALKECPGTTIGFIEADCGSMATFVFLACDTWGVSPYAEWFGHTVSSGSWGKECETFEASQFLRKQTHKRVQEEYSSFLFPEEIESLLKGSDIYLNADEIMERLEVFADAREAQGCNNPDCQECGVEREEQSTIDEIVENAVTRALEAYDKSKLQKEAKARKLAEKKVKPVVVFEEPVKE
jgi:ATP-dependent protease ClpP protease subunit